MKLRRVFLSLALLTLAALVGAEVFLRLRFQLGDPPLTVLHPTIGYLFKPDTEYRRFGNRIAYNAYGMRSDPMPRSKSRPGEQRILFLGDSVLNGGNQTDQAALASELVRARLVEEGRDVVVANASAKSWSVFNQLAYLREYGLFDADLVVLVSNFTDLIDTPVVRVPPLRDYPRAKPLLALQDFAVNYLPRYIPSYLPGSPEPEVELSPAELAPIQARAEVELAVLLQTIRQQVPRVLVYYTTNRDELTLGTSTTLEGFARVTAANDVPLHTSLAAYRQAEADGVKVLADRVHPTTQGQALLAAEWLPLIKALLPPQPAPATAMARTE